MVQWAERYRRLSKESSNGGRFIASRVEVARGPMLWATEPGVSKITLMACTQLLKTTCIENIAGRFIHVEPCPILGVFPKDDAAETFSKDRLAPMIRDTRVLRDLFGDAKSRDSGATLTHKQFPGGHITLVGANSPTNLAMRPIRLLVCDEIDKYPLSAGGEGSPIDLAEERQAEFKANSLTVVACSPFLNGYINNVRVGPKGAYARAVGAGIGCLIMGQFAMALIYDAFTVAHAPSFVIPVFGTLAGFEAISVYIAVLDGVSRKSRIGKALAALEEVRG